MAAEQLTLIPDWEVDEKEVQQRVIEDLRDFRALKVKLENQRERIDKGVVLFPSLRNANGITEIDPLEELIVKQMEKALNEGIDSIERSILELKYLSPVEMNDLDIYTELAIKKAKYYEKKRSAILRLAKSLGVI